MRRQGQGRTARQESAVKRQAVRDDRLIVEQVRELDRRLGVGVGAKRERARLAVPHD